MKRNGPQSTNLNQTAVADFLSYWRSKKSFQHVVSGSLLTFRGRVRYRWLSNDLRDESEVSILLSGVEPYRIEIEENGGLSVHTLHLGFQCEWGRIRFSKKRALLIQAKSNKLGGNYRVRIRPIRRD